MPQADPMLQEAIQALEAGQAAKAREILTRLLQADADNPSYWVYLSAAVESPKERRFCLERALALDPENEAARRGLILLGAQAPEAVEPVRLTHPRAWAEVEPEPEEDEATTAPLRRAAAALLVGVALLVLAALGWGGYRLWDRYRPRTFPTPALLIYATPNLTATVSARVTPTPSPTLPTIPGQPTPLWMLLSATYTPTPLFVNTPHPIEAYRLGLTAFRKGQWEQAVAYFRQVAEASGGQAADAYYYLGEAYSRLGESAKAEKAYRQAIEQDPHLAPAYVGLARLRLAADPEADVSDLLDQALEANPQYGEGYLERARFRLQHDDPQGALDDLDRAESLLGDSPLINLYRAQAYLALDDLAAARKAAQKAHQDITLLPAYKVLGQVDIALKEYTEAQDVLSTYVRYQPNDAEAYYGLAQAYRALGQPEQALEAVTQAHKLKPFWKEAMLLRVQLLVAQEDPQAAQQALDILTPWFRRNEKDEAINFWMGRAFFQLDKVGEAYWRFHAAVLAAEPESLSYYQALYWRAQTLTQLNSLGAAYRDWEAIAHAPEGKVPDAWRQEAQKQMQAIYTPTPGPSPTLPSTPTATPSPTPTP